MNVLEIKGLNKTYDSFKLKDVSFSVEEGHIAGFIGRNGAGKTTTIKSMLNLISIDSGEILYFGKNLKDKEREIKSYIGYSSGTISWYPHKKIKDIIKVVRRFYDSWNEEAYQKYLRLFELDENKTPLELSEGMKVKVNLLIALSHEARILILDEPTSGLDPFSRDELLMLLKELKKDKVAIFFSTHIISDIEKCADDIVYISKGQIIAAETKEGFIRKYQRSNESLEDIFLRLERGEDNA